MAFGRMHARVPLAPTLILRGCHICPHSVDKWCHPSLWRKILARDAGMRLAESLEGVENLEVGRLVDGEVRPRHQEGCEGS